MTTNSTMPTPSSTEGEQFLCDDWFDPLENGVRTRIRGFIEELLEAELDAALGRARYERPGAGGGGSPESSAGSRHGHRERRILGTFGATMVRVPRARLTTPEGKTREWRNATIPAYQRRTKRADALIAGAYLSGTNTRRVRRALAALFGGAVGKDTVSRVWRKTKGDWDVWNARSLADEPIVRLILDGTVVRVRLDKKATSISLLVALGVRSDGQKVLLAIKNMGGESEAAWRALLDNLASRGLKTPELVIVDGGSGLDKALAALWPDVPVQRCTVHKHRNLLAHAPDRLHEEVSADYNDMIYAQTRKEIEAKRAARQLRVLGGKQQRPASIRPVELPAPNPGMKLWPKRRRTYIQEPADAFDRKSPHVSRVVGDDAHHGRCARRSDQRRRSTHQSRDVLGRRPGLAPAAPGHDQPREPVAGR